MKLPDEGWRVSSLQQGFSLALKFLRRSKQFTILSAMWVAIGIATASVSAAIIEAAIAPTTPYENERSLLIVRASAYRPGSAANTDALYQALRNSGIVDQRSIGRLDSRRSVVRYPDGSLITDQVARVDSSLFRLLGVMPKQSRLSIPGSAVISHRSLRRLGANASRTASVQIDGRYYPIVASVDEGLADAMGVRLWVLSDGTGAPTDTNLVWPTIYVRTGSPSNMYKVRRFIDSTFSAKAAIHNDHITRLSFSDGRLDPLGLSQFHAAIVAAAIAFWLITCINIATLVMARSAERQRDLAIVTALGATRSDVLRLISSEAVIIACIGLLGGFFLTAWSTEAIGAALPPSLRSLGMAAPHLSWRVSIAVVLLAALTVLACGIVPGLLVSSRAGEALKEGGVSVTAPHRWHRALTILQIALSLVILFQALALARSVQRIAAYDFGFETHGVYFASLPRSKELRDSGFAAYLTNMRRQDGVRAVSLWGEFQPRSISVPGGGPTSSQILPRNITAVTPDILNVLQLKPIFGRHFLDGDAATGAAIIGADLDSALFGRGRSVGRAFHIGGAIVPVVGVIPRVKLRYLKESAFEDDPAVMIVPPPGVAPWNQVVFRVAPPQDSRALTSIARLEGDYSPSGFIRVRPFTSELDSILNARRFVSRLFVALALLGLAMSTFGLFASVSRGVAHRMREFAVRLALGATPVDIRRSVIVESLTLGLAGIVVGTPAAWAAAAFLKSVLYGIESMDWRAMILAELTILVTASLAAAVPGIRASRADPVSVLRDS